MRSVFVICFLLSSPFLFGQLGIKLGFHTVQVNSESMDITDPATNKMFRLSLKDAQFGYHVGVNYKIMMDNFFIMPEVVFNTNTATYELSELGNTKLYEERFQFVDIPLMLGFKVGILNLFGGPVGHIHMNNSTDMTDIQGFKQDFKSLHWGWQAGLGFDIWRLNIDLRYEGNFYKYGDHITFFDQSFNFQNSPHRIITSLGFTLGSR